MKPNNTSRLAAANAIAAAVLATGSPAFDGAYQHDRVTQMNAALVGSSYYTDSLTQYAVGYTDQSGLDAALDFFAPSVPVGRKFEYLSLSNADAFEHDADDSRQLWEDFKKVRMSKEMVMGKTVNRGLQITVDLDEEGDDSNWEQRKVGQLVTRLKRNALIRALALLDAAAVNTAKTWDGTAGQDPDQDMLQMIIDGADVSGMAANRIGIGQSAWAKRVLTHRAQTAAGGFASSGSTPAEVAGFTGVEEVFMSSSRYEAAGAKTQIMGDKVISFMAAPGLDREDASNIKRFYTPIDGGMYRVYRQEINEKLISIAVECYEQSIITSSLGIEKLTIS